MCIVGNNELFVVFDDFLVEKMILKLEVVAFGNLYGTVSSFLEVLAEKIRNFIEICKINFCELHWTDSLIDK